MRGLAGTLPRRVAGMMEEKGGRTGHRTAPTTIRRRDLKVQGQEIQGVVEWRCLSRRDARGGSEFV